MTNYWTKDQTRQEIITKTRIPNQAGFELFGTYYNFMDKKGLSFHSFEILDVAPEKLHRKNGFEYLVFQHEGFSEFIVLPNENLELLTERIVSKINTSENEMDAISLVIDAMN